MPVTRKEGKDTIIFVSKEDHAIPSQIVLPEPEPRPGLYLPNGEINWNCPCLGGMATGPCGIEFRNAFTCFQKSTGDPKGSECLELFQTMQVCMSNYPALYNKETELDLDELDNEDAEIQQNEERINITDVKNSEISDKVNDSIINSKKEIEIAKS